MTKSGVGTTTPTTATTSASTINNTMTTNTTTTTTINNNSSTPEIPIWVSDRKKWVTGISKKTTINDIIYAILKQCNINCDYEYINDYVLVEIMYSLVNNNNNNNSNTVESSSSIDQHQQHQNFVINSERVLKGSSKVYKYITKWTQNTNNLILKVKKCELCYAINDENSFNQSANSSIDATNANLDTTSGSNTNTISKFFKRLTHVNNSLISNSSNKLNGLTNSSNNASTPKQTIRYVDIKLPQQASSSSLTMSAAAAAATAAPSSSSSSTSSSLSTTQPIQQQQQQQTFQSIVKTPNANKHVVVNKAGIVPISSLQQQQQQNLNEYDYEIDNQIESNLPYKQYDPTIQKSFIITNIIDRDKKLNQQFECVKVLDELIKEAEKTLITNENYYYLYNQQQLLQQQQQQQQHQQQQQSPLLNNALSLNDIYSCFPEMKTHSSNEVDEFQILCNKLLYLDDNVYKQNQLLNKLEMDIQRELQLTNNNTSCNGNTLNALNDIDDLINGINAAANTAAGTTATLISTSNGLIETPETAKLKKEVSLSREQTRIQCKELHDLDLRMRQNESLLLHKENELKSLLEELYLQEIYMDTLSTTATIGQDNNIFDGYDIKKATLTSTASSTATNSKLKKLSNNIDGGSGNGGVLTSAADKMLSSSITSSTATTTSSSMASSSSLLTPPIEQSVNKTNVSTINIINNNSNTTMPIQQQQQQQHHSPPLANTKTACITHLPILSQTMPQTSTTSQPQQQQQQKTTTTGEHCDNDSGISSMSSENDAINHHNKLINNNNNNNQIMNGHYNNHHYKQLHHHHQQQQPHISPSTYLTMQQQQQQQATVKSVMETLV